MKYFLYIQFSLFFFSINNLESQNYPTFVYNLKYVKDSLEKNNYSQEKMLLILNDSVSIFESYNFRVFDSISQKMENEGGITQFGKIMNIPKTNFKFKLFKIKEDSTFLLTHTSIRSKFRYKEKNNIKWQIQKDTLTINGLLCRKATTNYAGRDYIAWYSDDIPISEGPYKFYGLPGLIIKLYDASEDYIFELTEIKYQNIIIDANFNEFQEITKKEYFAFLKNERETIGELGLIDRDPEIKRKILENKKKNNNPIELILE